MILSCALYASPSGAAQHLSEEEEGRWLGRKLSPTDRYFHSPTGAGRRWVVTSVTPSGAREEISL